MAHTVSALLALEIHRVLEDVEDRRDLLVRLWSMHRDRGPMLEAAFSRWKTLRSRELDALKPEVVVELDVFYSALESWLEYLRETEDMPLHLDVHWRQHHMHLVATGRRALELLDAPPRVEVPEADRDGRSFLEGFALQNTDLAVFTLEE